MVPKMQISMKLERIVSYILIVRCVSIHSPHAPSHKLSRVALATADWGRRSANPEHARQAADRPPTFTFASSFFLFRSINFAAAAIAANEPPATLRAAICLRNFLSGGANQDMRIME